MKFPTQHITKLTLAVTKGIVMSVVFIAGVSIGIFNILMKYGTQSKRKDAYRVGPIKDCPEKYK